ncbi:MAG: Gfo/Idh/MocA family protein [Coprobacillaceae bacterium]
MIHWGIIGAGRIAHRFAEGLAYDKEAKLYAVACRTLPKAEAFKEKYPCEVAYDSYDAILEDENIDVVYIALPHGYHHEWSKKAILKGKAVLCEKPAMMNAKEMQEIKELSAQHQVFFMEALKTRFIPLYIVLKKLIADGVIGDVTKVETSFCSEVPYTSETYFYDTYQGGCLLDTGIYTLGYVDDYVKGDFTIEILDSKFEHGVDTHVKAIIKTNNATGIIECAFNQYKPRVGIITGTKGNIMIEESHRPQKAVITVDGKTPYTIEKAYENDDFYSQIHHVNQCLLQNKIESSIMSQDDSLRCAKIQDAIKEALQ